MASGEIDILVTQNKAAAGLIAYMDSNTYKAAVEGEIKMFKGTSQHLDLLLTPNKNTVLHINIAAQTGDSTDFVEQVLQICPSLLLQINTKGETALHIAARQGKAATVRFLLQFAKALPAKNDFAKTHHDHEIDSGVEVAKQMLRMQNNEKDTPFHEAARYNHLDVVRELAQADRDFPYSTNEAGETPLYLAAERGYPEVLSEILQTCTSPLHKGPNGRTTLHAAVICKDIEMTRKILEAKRTLTKEADQQGWTPLHYAADMGDDAPAVEQLLECDKSAAYIADREGKKTALHIAAGRGHIGVMNVFLSSCPDCYELVDSRGWNVLHFAVESNIHEGVQLVLKYSCVSNLINEKDAEGNTPLHYVAASPACMPVFISHPKVDAVAKQNLRALGVVSSEIEESIVEYSRGAGSISRQRVIIAKDNNNSLRGEERGGSCTSKNSDGGINKQSESRNRKEGHLIVASLVATVTFAAAFTMPGGYISTKGHDQGTAVLTKEAAFIVFVFSDSIAMMLSSFAVCIHLFSSGPDSIHLFSSGTHDVFVFALESYCITIAMCAMMVAYIAGTYAVLSRSAPQLAIATCVLGSFFCTAYTIWFYFKVRPQN